MLEIVLLVLTIGILKGMRKMTHRYANIRDLMRFDRCAYVFESKVTISISY